MRNLLLFLIRYNAFFLFVILEIISFSLIVNNGTDSQKTILFSSANNFTGFFMEKYNNILQYWHLPEENEKLARENAQLKAQLRRDKFNHKVDTTMVFDSIYEQQYKYIPALVINNSVGLQNNYITLNRGRKHDIERNAGVISSDGIVGIIQNTSYRYSTVLSLLHRDMKISATIKRTNYYGSLVWKNNNPTSMTLEAIPKHASVEINDTIITSGYSSIFPKGLMIGIVDTFWIEAGSNFHTINVKLSADLNKIRNVYVVKDFLKQEKLKLEKQTADE
jgi:rod shape-determining protein MreC